MGKAGFVIRQVLEEYEVSQHSLAAALDIEPNRVYRWANEKRDPSAETVLEIVSSPGITVQGQGKNASR